MLIALMSKRLRLHTINVNVPIDIDIEKFRLREPDYDEADRDFTPNLNSNSFLKKLKITPQKNVQMSFRSGKTIIETADQIDKLSDGAKERERVYIKTSANFRPAI